MRITLKAKISHHHTHAQKRITHFLAHQLSMDHGCHTRLLATYTDLKKWLDRDSIVWKLNQKISPAAILFGTKKLRVVVRCQCEITLHGLSNASLKILELLGGMYSTHF